MKYKNNIILFLISTMMALLLGEGLLWMVLGDASQKWIWPPGMNVTFQPNPEFMPGISGDSKFRVNSMGIRGDEIENGVSHKIIAIGGSTTECLYLDQDETWPCSLQQKLNAEGDNKYWIGNAGKSGLNTFHHIEQLKHIISTDKFEDLDKIILLVGINDFLLFLADSDAYLNRPQDEIIAKTFSINPTYEALHPFYKRSGFYRLLRKLKHQNSQAKEGTEQDSGGKIYDQWRDHRKKATTLIDSFPSLERALRTYAGNLSEIARLAKENNIELIIADQPVMWKDSLSPELAKLTWMGGIGKYQIECCGPYYTFKALDDGMKAFNQIAEKVAVEQGLIYIDLNNRLSGHKDTTVFYDDCHFNESGARYVAEHIYDVLSE